jgi:ElaB/YqjD/DUF883 family membrane-anchored ribosome-binding protein
MSMNTPLANGRERLAQDLRQIVSDADRFLATAAETGDSKFNELRDRLATQVEQMRSQIDELEGRAADKARLAVRATDEAVHTHPYGAMGIAAAVGLLVGFLAARR